MFCCEQISMYHSTHGKDICNKLFIQLCPQSPAHLALKLQLLETRRNLHLDRVSDWAWSPVPLPHTALEPRTHMGAIICKVAAVAPGNDLKEACMCMCVCAMEHAARVCLLSVITSTRLQ